MGAAKNLPGAGVVARIRCNGLPRLGGRASKLILATVTAEKYSTQGQSLLAGLGIREKDLDGRNRLGHALDEWNTGNGDSLATAEGFPDRAHASRPPL